MKRLIGILNNPLLPLLLLLSPLLHSMDLVPLLKKNRPEKHTRELHEAKTPLVHYVVTSLLPKEARSRTALYIQQLYGWNKKCMKSVLEIQKKVPHCSERYPCILKGAGLGGFCGLVTGSNALGIYNVLSCCMWCWCDIITPSNTLCNLMVYGLPTCTCVGCSIGACCVITGCSKKIDFIFE